MSTTSSPVPSDPASTTGHSTFRPSRRRGLSYLRNYTHHRLSSFAGQNTEPLSTSPSLQPETLQRVVSSPTQPTTSDGHLVTPADSPRLSTTENHGNSVYPITEQRPPSTEPPATSTVNTVNSALGGISRLMARHRAGSAPQGKDRRTTSEPGSSSIAFGPGPVAGAGPGAGAGLTGYPLDQMPTIRLIPHQDPRSARPSLTFPPMSRTLPHEDCVIRVGRYSERDTNPNPPPNVPSSAPVGFKSKVVSRRHCEFWCSNGQWYIKDVKSSSGTFLNHIRLSQPSVESRPWPLNDGDVVQLGIDFRGGEEMIFRCVKIRVECNRGWQKSLNNFKYLHQPRSMAS